MTLYNLKDENLKKIEEISFNLEKDIQDLTQKNLEEIFNLEFVTKEFSLNNMRIDSLAYDRENNCFIIIEYKRDKNFSVIDQGYAYLSLMLNNKADFILEYNEKQNMNLKRDDIDWSQSKVIFISPSFSRYQKQAINFKDLPIELWEINKYKNNIIQYIRLESADNSESINIVSKSNNIVKNVSKEIKTYTEKDYLEKRTHNKELVSLYNELKENIFNLGDDISVVPKYIYIAFKRNKNFIDIEFQKNNIIAWLNIKNGELVDPLGISNNVAGKGHHGNGDYELKIKNSSDILKSLPLIKQSYLKN